MSVITALLLCAAGAFLCFYSLWRVHNGSNFWWGLLLLLALPVFASGIYMLLDSIEQTT
jgi:hypothetical protein